MSERVKYEGAEKRYYVSKPKKRLKYGAWFSILVLPAIIFIILGFFLTKDAITVDDENKVTYNELGKVDYKVYLKENDYYDKPFLDKGMQYIASLIRSINVKFNYEIHTTEELDYHYAYDISANLVVTDKNDPTKVLYERPEVLLNNKTVDITDNNFVINEDIDIDYDKYNEYVNAFKSEYALTVDSNLVITLTVKTEGNYELTNEELKKDNTLTVTIPLSEQTINIGLETDDINESGTISNVTSAKIQNPLTLAGGILFDILGITFIGAAIYI